MDIVARWPGSCHDQTIFKKSKVYTQLISGKWGNGLVVADSGYADSRHIITPFINPQNRIEQLYNESINNNKLFLLLFPVIIQLLLF